ncbi:CHL4 family chromosome segregation protein-like protein [Plenodomus tracheiphilus IPT5]|uniref:CHL4 family chromosome segregation protein-like protein n=1 Tax=Plenodomus tracheiphilus IPT5 TaxID=1408161 RepID=A0A6A7AVH5_9PLEO|nr:CHL4 family chromosome segregation protein-like protein [Plenodomus tracheiphilus IPT5]
MATAPDYKNIPHSHRLPVSHREVQRTFTKLSRQSLTSLAQQWLSKKNRDFCKPYLLNDRRIDGAGEDDDEDDEELYTPAQSYEALQEIYRELAARKGGRREVLDRILEGDWRTGISMYQLATAEIQYLLDHPNALRWTAKRLTRIPNARSAVADMEVTNDSDHLPRFQAQTFMSNLARELTPLMKAHYLITRIKTSPMTILRVYIHDSPYSNEASLAADSSSADSAKAVFFIWPNGSPFVYSSLATLTGQVVGDDGRHLRDIVQQAIPRAFSRPSARYQLTTTNFTTKSLDALLTYRGPGKSNAATGGWSIFQDHSFSQNALDFITTLKADEKERNASSKSITNGTKPGPGRPKRPLDDKESPEAKRRKEVAAGRFGSSAKPDDGQGVERVEVRIDDPFPTGPDDDTLAQINGDTSSPNDQTSNRSRRGRPSLLDRTAEDLEEIQSEEGWVPSVRVTFQGTHIFAGIRQLAEEGIVDGEQMPGWMTGEAGVTIGSVREGRIRTKDGVPGL